MCADEENQKFYDELSAQPYQGLTIRELKERLAAQATELAELREGSVKEKKRRESLEGEVHSLNLELHHAKSVMKNMEKQDRGVPSKMFNYVTEQMHAFQKENASLHKVRPSPPKSRPKSYLNGGKRWP